MRIETLHIGKLFGHYNYEIALKENITIIHGPNGCGKTTVLKIIDAVFDPSPKMDVLKKIDFQFVNISFTDGYSLQIQKKEMEIKRIQKDNSHFTYLAYSLKTPKGKKVFDPASKFDNSEEYALIMDNLLKKPRVLPYIERIADNLWLDRRDGEQLSAEEVIDRCGSALIRRLSNFDDTVPLEVKQVLSQVKVLFISTDRLTVQKRIEKQYGEDSLRIERKVSEIAKDISEKVKSAIQKYAQISQSKDRTFPLRAIRAVDPLSIEQIKDKMVELESKRKQFVENGILEEESDIDIHELLQSIKEENRQNLSLYAIDTEEKLDALSDLSKFINLFRTLVEKNFTEKHIVFNKDDGFYFVTKHTNTTIKPDSLSSGEQHELVMFYDLIFNTSENTLVLIDEPELSLHIKWQLNYINELLDIIEVSKFYSIVATHSPQIIHDNWDITISLTSEE